MTVRAVRGAVQVDADAGDSILQGTTELVTAVMTRNDLPPDRFRLHWFWRANATSARMQ
jgi:chorismate mutase